MDYVGCGSDGSGREVRGRSLPDVSSCGMRSCCMSVGTLADCYQLPRVLVRAVECGVVSVVNGK